jgi:hypothetical protein
MELSNVFSYVDAAALIIVATAVLYFWGYAYYFSFFAVYGVSINFFTLSFQTYVLTSWKYVLWIVGTLLTAYFLYGLFIFVYEGNPNLPQMIRNLLSKSGLGMLLLLIFLAIIFITLHITHQAQRDALSAAHNKKRIELTTKTTISLPSPLYFLAFTGNKYIVYAEIQGASKAQVYILNDQDISVATFPRD